MQKIDDTRIDFKLATPQCEIRMCEHWLQDGGMYQPDGTEQTEVVVCPAFPEGIPDEIAYGSNLHTEVYPGQKGDIVFSGGA